MEAITMNDYQFKVSDCINDRLVEFAMTEAKSIYNLGDVMILFHNPEQHYSKIMCIAYNKTITEMKK
jgi:hypothetical protein